MSVLIVSQEDDKSTSDVILWIKYYNKKVFRINRSDFFSFSKRISNASINCKLSPIVLDEKITKVWFRKISLRLYQSYILKESEFKKDLIDRVNAHIVNELRSLNDTFNRYLAEQDCDILSSPDTVNINKIDVLREAAKIGLKIPDTLLTNNAAELVNFISSHEKCITKAIGNNFSFQVDDGAYIQYTQLLDKSDLDGLDSAYIFPAIYQECIPKKQDIRAFVINNEVYSMAIFSQESLKTKLDFRNYDMENHNRCVPFKLPPDIEIKLLELFRNLALKTGSVDIIYTTSREFVFLEINPIGQFGMVSKLCNYYIEKKIAEILCHEK